MKKNTLLLFTVLFIVTFSFAQTMPIDFSDGGDNFSVWGGSTFAIVPSPTDSGNPTGEFFRSGTTAVQGHYIDLSQPIDLDESTAITMRFYSFDADSHNVVVKLENGTNPNIELSLTVSPNQNSWSELNFDFSAVGGSGPYSRLVIRIDDGSVTPGAFRIDDINDGSEPTDPNELDVIYDELVWSDEFDSTTPEAVDNSKWYHQTFGPNGGQWFNGEQQHYTDRLDNSYVQDGFLTVVAKSESFNQNGVTLQYTSARLNSKYAFKYGRVDVRARLPFGSGTWPAIWTLGKNINETGAYWQTQGFGEVSWPACGELDIMEHGLHADNEVSVAIHTPSSFGNTINTAKQMLVDVANDFHVYSMNWSPDEIAFMVDDDVIYRYNPANKNPNTWPFDLEQYLILNVAMGGFAGTIDPSFTESSMVIDYVRVYQNSLLSVKDFQLPEVTVYPNPTDSILTIETDVAIGHVEVVNLVGQVVIAKDLVEDSINVSALPKGVYILNLFSGGRAHPIRFVKN